MKTYDLDGEKYGPIETCGMYVDVLKEFKKSHPDFAGSKFIYAPLRSVNDETFNTYLPIMQKLQKNFPDFIAGFDVVGQEDKGIINILVLIEFAYLNFPLNDFTGRPLIEYAEKLLKFPENINFFFHAGETNWMGTTTDENLVNFFLIIFKTELLPSV